MCQSQHIFWKCRHLASGAFHLCASYSATLGRQCDGYTSFARVINCDCPSCRRTDQSTSTHVHAEIDSEQATAGADEIDWGNATESDKEKERRRRVNAWVAKQSESSRKSTTNDDLEEATLGAQEVQEETGSSPETSESGSEHTQSDEEPKSTPEQTSQGSKLEDCEE